jgi:hypothetical protein
MPLCNGTDTGCVSSIDNIAGRESGLTSFRCFPRENWANRHMRQDDDSASGWCSLTRGGRMVRHGLASH